MVVEKKPYNHHSVPPKPASWSAPPFWERGLTRRRQWDLDRQRLVLCGQLREDLRSLSVEAPIWHRKATELRRLQRELGLTPTSHAELAAGDSTEEAQS